MAKKGKRNWAMQEFAKVMPPVNVSQEEWDRIFPPERRAPGPTKEQFDSVLGLSGRPPLIDILEGAPLS
jgi:hypothetical protein